MYKRRDVIYRLFLFFDWLVHRKWRRETPILSHEELKFVHYDSTLLVFVSLLCFYIACVVHSPSVLFQLCVCKWCVCARLRRRELDMNCACAVRVECLYARCITWQWTSWTKKPAIAVYLSMDARAQSKKKKKRKKEWARKQTDTIQSLE